MGCNDITLWLQVEGQGIAPERREDGLIRETARPACHLQDLVRFLWSGKTPFTNDVSDVSKMGFINKGRRTSM